MKLNKLIVAGIAAAVAAPMAAGVAVSVLQHTQKTEASGAKGEPRHEQEETKGNTPLSA